MAIQGVVSFAADPNQLTTVSDLFAADVAALRPGPPLAVRIPVATSQVSLLAVEAYRTSLATWRRAGMAVQLVLLRSMVTVPGANPNDPLDQQFSNPYIRAYADAVVDFLQDLGGYCPRSVWLWNEPNASGIITPGQPAVKPTALAPSVFAALVYTTAQRIRAQVPNVWNVWPGALSCLIQTNTNPSGSWVGGYLHAAFTWLVAQGVTLGGATPLFSGLWLNMEGNVTAAYAASCRAALDALQTEFHLSGPMGVSEWGQTNNVWDSTTMQGVYTAINTNFDAMYLFQHPWLSNSTDYGLTAWKVSGGQLVPNGHSPSYADMQKFFAATP